MLPDAAGGSGGRSARVARARRLALAWTSVERRGVECARGRVWTSLYLFPLCSFLFGGAFFVLGPLLWWFATEPEPPPTGVRAGWRWPWTRGGTSGVAYLVLHLCALLALVLAIDVGYRRGFDAGSPPGVFEGVGPMRSLMFTCYGCVYALLPRGLLQWAPSFRYSAIAARVGSWALFGAHALGAFDRFGLPLARPFEMLTGMTFLGRMRADLRDDFALLCALALASIALQLPSFVRVWRARGPTPAQRARALDAS